GGTSLSDLNAMQTVKDHFKPMHIKTSDVIISLFEKIYKTLESGYSIDNLVFSNLCFSHFLTLFLFNAKHFEAHVTRTDIIDEVIRYMQENINKNITLNDLCHQFYYSPSRFSSLFKQRTGYSPIDYFIQLKMQKASQLLDFTDQSIKDIAATFGFDDPYYFSRRFRKTIGMSPKKYRSIHKD
ncbi:MAG TPA: AraC family transcriptional regulator, partial [Flavisolibacter sp.]|nr:AraC family transcriptional regulator [Flavisolibacter sp.]